MCFLYILRSTSSQRYDVRPTQNVEQRLAYHNAGYSKALRNRGPWQLVYTEPYATRAEAVMREREIKSWKDRSVPVTAGEAGGRIPSSTNLLQFFSPNSI